MKYEKGKWPIVWPEEFGNFAIMDVDLLRYDKEYIDPIREEVSGLTPTPGGRTTLISLTDTPDEYPIGTINHFLVVNKAGTGIEFYNPVGNAPFSLDGGYSDQINSLQNSVYLLQARIDQLEIALGEKA